MIPKVSLKIVDFFLYVAQRPHDFEISCNTLVANIGPCNRHLALKQCLNFRQSIYLIFCWNRSFEQIQSVSKSEIHVFSSTEVQISCRNLRKFVSLNWRVQQSESNKNRICSDSWSSCNARILLVKA